MQKTPYVVLIATLLLFGFWPQPMLDRLEPSVQAVHYRIENGIDASVEAARDSGTDTERGGNGHQGGGDR